MDIVFTPHAFEDLSYWTETDADIVIKIKNLLKAIKSEPFRGVGKPEPLKYDLKGFWSRRITDEHRLVYRVTGKRGENQRCVVVQCRYHYDKK